MKQSRAWKSGGPGTGSICYVSTGAGRIGIGGIGGGSSQRTYALSGIHPRCVRGLLSHNDNDPLQKKALTVAVRAPLPPQRDRPPSLAHVARPGNEGLVLD